MSRLLVDNWAAAAAALVEVVTEAAVSDRWGLLSSFLTTSFPNFLPQYITNYDMNADHHTLRS